MHFSRARKIGSDGCSHISEDVSSFLGEPKKLLYFTLIQLYLSSFESRYHNFRNSSRYPSLMWPWLLCQRNAFSYPCTQTSSNFSKFLLQREGTTIEAFPPSVLGTLLWCDPGFCVRKTHFPSQSSHLFESIVFVVKRCDVHHIFTRYSCIYPMSHCISLKISPNNTIFASNIITKPHKMHFSHSYKGLGKCTFLELCTMHFCKARTTVHLTLKARMVARTFPKTRALARLRLGLSMSAAARALPLSPRG